MALRGDPCFALLYFCGTVSFVSGVRGSRTVAFCPAEAAVPIGTKPFSHLVPLRFYLAAVTREDIAL